MTFSHTTLCSEDIRGSVMTEKKTMDATTPETIVMKP